MDKKLLIILLLNLVLYLIVRFTKAKKGWHNFFVFIFTVFLTLTVLECGYRFLIKKDAFVMRGNQGFGSYAPNDVTGYTLARPGTIQLAKVSLNGDTIYNTVYTVIPDSGLNDLHINHRVAFRPSHTDPEAYNEIVFLGCSITYGEGIHDNETFAWKTGELCNTPSLNLGFSGYGTHQAYQVYRNKYYQHPDNKKRVFVYSFIPDHVLRAKCIYPWSNGDPYFAVSNDSLILKGKAYKESNYALTHKLTRYLSLFYSFTFISDLESAIVINKASKAISAEDYQRPALMLREMQRDMAAHDDRFIIVYWDKYKWNNKDDEKSLSRKTIEEMMDKLKGQGAEVLKVSDVINVNDSTNFIKGDGHPTAHTNALLAAAIAKQVCNH